jgi:antitoxin MazE
VPDTLVKPSKITRWGNSAAVRLSASVLERANLHRDDAVDIIARDDEIIIRRQVPHLTLDDLLARFDPEKHRHDLMLDGDPIGRETI